MAVYIPSYQVLRGRHLNNFSCTKIKHMFRHSRGVETRRTETACKFCLLFHAGRGS